MQYHVVWRFEEVVHLINASQAHLKQIAYHDRACEDFPD